MNKNLKLSLAMVLMMLSISVIGQTYVTLPYSTDFTGSGATLSGEWAEVSGSGYKARRKNWANNYPANGGEEGSGKALSFYTTSTQSSDVYPEAWLYADLSNVGSISLTFDVVDNSSVGILDSILVDISVDDGSSFTNNLAFQQLHVLPHSDRIWNTITLTADLSTASLVGTSTSVIRLRANTKTQYVDGGAAYWTSTGHIVAVDDFSVTALTVLPVTWADFTCDNSRLNWSTYAEHNNDFFMVEYSIDGMIWSEEQMVIGSGNSNEKIEYSIEINRKGYYRVKQTDYNGKSDYFNSVLMCGEGESRKIIGIYNQLGQKVDENFEGIRLIRYSDNTSSKIMKCFQCK